MESALATSKSPYPSISKKLTATVFRKVGIAKPLRNILDVTYGAGVRPLITAALHHLASQGKTHFLLPIPNWLSYQPLIQSIGAHCLPVDIIALATHRKDYFATYLKQLDEILTHAHVFVFTPYNNPMGIQYTARETEAIIHLLKKHRHVTIVVDDIYRELCPAPLPTLLDQYPELHDRCIYIAGTTKSHSLRAGYAIAPKAIAKAMDDYLRLVYGTPLSKFKMAGLEKALTTPVPSRKLAKLFRKRDLMIKELHSITGWTVINKKPDGGNYVLVNIEQDMRKIHCGSAKAYADKLKAEARIIVTAIDRTHIRFSVRIDSLVLTAAKSIQRWQQHRPRHELSDGDLLRNLCFLNAPRHITHTLTLHDTPHLTRDPKI